MKTSWKIWFSVGSLALMAIWAAHSILTTHRHLYSTPEAHTTEVDVEYGKYTFQQLKELENTPPDTAKSTKTPPVNLDAGHGNLNDILTIVIDFKDGDQELTSDVFGNVVGAFSVVEFGFQEEDFQLVTDAIFEEVLDDFFDELANTIANENGGQLNIQFRIGDIGTPPPGISEYYFIQVGQAIDGPFTSALGVAAGRSVRDSSGCWAKFWHFCR